MTSSVTDLEHFGAKLFSTISQANNGHNVFLSPTSISLAVSMCTLGAQNETLKQMLGTLEVSSIKELTNTAEQVMQVFPVDAQDTSPLEKLSDLDQPVSYQRDPDGDGFKVIEFKLVNRLYMEQTYEVEKGYLDIVKKLFHSAVKLEDFENESAKAVQTINTWVESQTNQRIRDILSTDDVNSDTRLVLVNCIYFKGQWQDKFRETSTDKNADFHEANGVTSKVELMYQQEYHSYAENKDLRVQIAHLLYQGSSEGARYVFTVVLPNEGVQLDDVEQKLTSNLQLRQQVLNTQNATSKELKLYLPKFKLETKYELGDVLINMGMKDAFSDKKADFGGIIGEVTDANRIKISKVIHKTFLDVNEDGTEAAAATAITMERCLMTSVARSSPIEFKANRPFLFFIREAERNLILFSGKLVSPSASKK